MVECEEAALELLVAYEHFAETVEPAMADLNNPASGLLLRGAPLDCCLCSATDDVRDVAVTLDGAQVLGTTVACVGAQVFVSSVGRVRALDDEALSTASSLLQSWTLAPLTTSDNGTPRPSTSKWRLLPFFLPVRRVRADSFLRQGCLHHRAIDA